MNEKLKCFQQKSYDDDDVDGKSDFDCLDLLLMIFALTEIATLLTMSIISTYDSGICGYGNVSRTKIQWYNNW